MAKILEYKCPCCDGKIEFDSGLQQMKCPFCETTFDVSTLQDYDDILNQQTPQEEMQWDTDAGSEWEQDEAAYMGVFACTSCGGELVTNATTAATSCPYCGNPVVLTGRLNAAAPTAGTGYETFAIAATIIGGTSFFGGVGKIPGVVAGGLIIGIINYGMTVLMIDASMQKVVMGALIIIAVTLDHFVSKSSSK